MKTDQSIIEKKLNLKLAQDIITDLGVLYLKKWTDIELKKYKNKPIVIPTGPYGFLVGQYKISGVNKECWQVSNINDDIIHNFINKTNAIIYCLLLVTKKYLLAQELLNLDLRIGKLDADIHIYERYLKTKRNKDDLKYSIMLNRCIDAKFKKAPLVKNLTKTINLAKYINFGN
jgi:hypothetical protein